jgi:ribonucleotide monophosphatase NagD (HAD superfamily)
MTVTTPASGTDCTTDDLIDRYDVFLLDAYGVLVTTRGAIDGAYAYLDRLNGAGREWMFESNDAARSI